MVLEKLLNRNFYLRLLTLIIGLPIAILVLKTGGYLLVVFILSISFLLGCEWGRLVEYEKSNLYHLLGLLYIILPCFSFLYLAHATTGSVAMLSLCSMIWASDIGAYLTGKIVGGPKINIDISPNKTWSGYYGGLLFTMLVGYFFREDLGVAVFISIFAQLGDFLESKIKRKFGVSDSGNLLPGHGGLLDRFDSFTLVVPIIAFIHYIG
jgi:phosphatidate cytidylyltransferase